MVHVAAALKTSGCLAFIRNKSVETRAQKRLKAGLARVVTRKIILLERVGKKSLRQVFCVLVAGLPFEANVFVDWFPITIENGVESTPADDLVIAARGHDSGVVRDRKPVEWTTDVSVWIDKRDYACLLTITSVMSSAA